MPLLFGYLIADKFISAPEFSGHSYIALPTLTNAYSDLQLSMEFRQVCMSIRRTVH